MGLRDTVHTPPANRVVLLGAGKPARSAAPAALSLVQGSTRVMDWLLDAFADLHGAQLHFVSGFRHRDLLATYPDLPLVYNPDWAATGPTGSLAVAPLSSTDATWVSYADVVFRREIVERMAAAPGDLVLAVDSAWRQRYDGRAGAQLTGAEKVVIEGDRVVDLGRDLPAEGAAAEFVGLARMSPALAARARALLDDGTMDPTSRFPKALRLLLGDDVRVTAVDVQGDWAELNLPQDLAHFVLGTKAESLARLAPLVRASSVGTVVAFTQAQWRADADAQLAAIRAALGERTLICRSSALSEDQWGGSAAGAYESVPNVPGGDPAAVRAAVEAVLASYTVAHEHDQVLVQEMLTGVRMSGVVMTRTPSDAAPWVVFNFDDTTSRTDTVTAGTGSFRTVFLHRDAPLTPDLEPALAPVLAAVREVEALVGHDSLDIEFAITHDGQVHLLQVRPIAVPRLEGWVDDARIAAAMDTAADFIATLQRPAPFVVGASTQLSVMSDWNPAEIIGTKPRRLAFSLYRYLVTDEVWAVQRAEYGYRDTRPCNLLVDLLGHPYIDVRATFNSFVPAALPDDLAGRLVDSYLQQLQSRPELHDKVEFDVLFTCLTLDFADEARRRLGHVLSDAEIAQLGDALREITRKGMTRCADDMAQVLHMEARRAQLLAADLPPLERAWMLLEDLRRFGTPAFAHLARAGFVAVSLLRSLDRAGVLGAKGLDAFMASLETASSTLQHHAHAVHAGAMSWRDFVAEYGHLRPGTYDVTSPAYASAPESFLRPIVAANATPPHAPEDPWSPEVRAAISQALGDMGLDADTARVERFFRDAIEGRERSKFLFTRNLSAALDALAEFGEAHGVPREALAHVRIEELWALRAAHSEQVAEVLERRVAEGRRAFSLTQAVPLPAQVFSPAQLRCFERLAAVPNFVTKKTVRAKVVCLTGSSSPDIEVEGRIAVIPNADPGFDWLFGRNVAGLVTMYGGSNSHMAIRAAEFELPATIGVGELLFETLVQADVIELDCASQTIRVVR